MFNAILMWAQVETRAAAALLHAFSKLSLADAITSGHVDPITARYVHPQSNQQTDLRQALQ